MSGVWVIMIVFLAGCAVGDLRTPGSPSTTTPTSSVTANSAAPHAKSARVVIDPLSDPASLRRVTYAATLASDPLPDAPPRVAVDRQQALAVASSPGETFGGMEPGVPSATLRMVIEGDPAADPAPVAHPAWVVIWDNSPLVIFGPATLSQEARAQMIAGAHCVFVLVIDAQTAKATSAHQACVSRTG